MSIKDKAKKSLGGSELIQGREKLDNGLLIATYPNGITIDGIDILTGKDDKTGEDKQFTVYTFKEDPKRYAAGGQILTEMFQELVSEYENLAQFNEALRQEGGLRVKLSIKKGKNSGNKYTAVVILD